MTERELILGAKTLESKILSAAPSKRHEFQPELHAFLRRIERGGLRVPPRLRRLDHELVEEAIEARFDNMPV